MYRNILIATDDSPQAGTAASQAIELNEIKIKAAETGISVTTTLEEGTPAQVILDYAEARGIDLVILGGKTKSTAERFFIGNTTEKVVRHAPMSVLVVREERE